MIARRCTSCKVTPERGCTNAPDCGDVAPLAVHDHDYDEWWCRGCWVAFSDGEREDADAHEVVDVRQDAGAPVEFGAGAKWR